MTQATVQVDSEALARAMHKLVHDQTPFATALALNDTAFDAKAALQREMERSLDRPTPFTKRGVFTARATKAKQESAVGIMPRQSEYLKFQIKGGTRRPNRKAIPVPVNTRLNQYGNMPRRAVGRLIARPDTFIATPKAPRTAHLPPGIYQRFGASRNGKAARPPKLLVAFERTADYKPILDMHGAISKTASLVYRKHFEKRLAHAIRTAR